MVVNTILVTHVGIFNFEFSKNLHKSFYPKTKHSTTAAHHQFENYTQLRLFTLIPTLATPKISASELLRTHYRMAAAGPTS